MSKPKNNLYMITLNNEPAYFHPGERMLFFAQNGIKIEQLFLQSLEEVKQCLAADVQTRLDKGYSPREENNWKISYLRVRIP
jgi:hypothetical protein